MIKRFFTIIFLAGILFTACNTGNQKAEADTKECIEEKACLTVDDFLANAADYVGKEVDIDGTVNHVCKHGGKRMFIFGKNPEATAKIVTGEELANFDVALEGSDVCVHGMVEELRIDEAYLADWEAELEAKAIEEESHEGHDHAEGEEHEGDEHHGDGSGHGDKADMGEHKAEIEKIKMYRDKLAADSVDHFSFYTIVATKFSKMEAKEEVETKTEEVVTEEVEETETES
jgi:hypothetical protein